MHGRDGTNDAQNRLSEERLARIYGFSSPWASYWPLSQTVSAHDFWIDRKGQEFLVIYGHGDQREEFDFSKVKTVKAFGPGGAEIEVRREKKRKRITPSTCRNHLHGYSSRSITAIGPKRFTAGKTFPRERPAG